MTTLSFGIPEFGFAGFLLMASAFIFKGISYYIERKQHRNKHTHA